MAKFAKFAGNKTLAQIKAQCKAAGVEFDDRRFQTMGDDHIVVRGGGAYAIFNTVNGRFFGTTDTGEEFSSDDRRDGTPWFDALLRFFYVTKSA